MFWDKLTTLCNENHISPNKLCKTLGFSNATATKWKRGSIPRDTALKSIADYFNVSVDYLLDREPTDTFQTSVFWGKFTELCIKNNVSPNAVGNVIGVSSSSITGWRNGAQPRNVVLVKICDYFKLPYDYFDSNDNTNSQTIEPDNSIPETIELPLNISSDDWQLIKFILSKYK